MSADFLKAMSEPPTVAAKPEASIKRVPSVTLTDNDILQSLGTPTSASAAPITANSMAAMKSSAPHESVMAKAPDEDPFAGL